MKYKLSSEDMLFIAVPAFLGIFFAVVMFLAITRKQEPQVQIVRYERIDCKK